MERFPGSHIILPKVGYTNHSLSRSNPYIWAMENVAYSKCRYKGRDKARADLSDAFQKMQCRHIQFFTPLQRFLHFNCH